MFQCVLIVLGTRLICSCGLQSELLTSPDEDGCEEIIRGNGLFGSSVVREFQEAAKAHNSEKQLHGVRKLSGSNTEGSPMALVDSIELNCSKFKCIDRIYCQWSRPENIAGVESQVIIVITLTVVSLSEVVSGNKDKDRRAIGLRNRQVACRSGQTSVNS